MNHGWPGGRGSPSVTLITTFRRAAAGCRGGSTVAQRALFASLSVMLVLDRGSGFGSMAHKLRARLDGWRRSVAPGPGWAACGHCAPAVAAPAARCTRSFKMSMAATLKMSM